MNSDIRLLTSFRGHRKRRRLERLIGPGATGFLIDLWLAAAQDRPEGVLDGWDPTDIALAANWEKDPSELVQALLDTGFLDKGPEGHLILHDWREHQSWVCGAKTRSESARLAAAMRWNVRLANADSAQPHCAGNAPPMRAHAAGIAPSPSPLPDKDPPPDVAALKSRYPNSGLIDQALAAIASTRKSGRISPGVVSNLLRQWAAFPPEQVESAIRIYLQKNCAAEGKGEKYLAGIMRLQKPGEVVSNRPMTPEWF